MTFFISVCVYLLDLAESLAAFSVKTETESLNIFVFRFGPNPEVKYPNPNLFKKDRTRTSLQPKVLKIVS